MTGGNPRTVTSPCWHTDPESSSSKHTSSQLHQSAAINHNQQHLQLAAAQRGRQGQSHHGAAPSPAALLPQLTASPRGTEPQGLCSQPLQHHLLSAIASGLPQSMLMPYIPHSASSHPLHTLLSTLTGPVPRGSSSQFPVHLQYRHIHVPLGSIPHHAMGAQTAPVPQPSHPHIPLHEQIPTHSFPRPTIPSSPPSTPTTYQSHNPQKPPYPINPTIPPCPTVLQHPYTHTSPQAVQSSKPLSPIHTPWAPTLRSHQHTHLYSFSTARQRPNPMHPTTLSSYKSQCSPQEPRQHHTALPTSHPTAPLPTPELSPTAPSPKLPPPTPQSRSPPIPHPTQPPLPRNPPHAPHPTASSPALTSKHSSSAPRAHSFMAPQSSPGPRPHSPTMPSSLSVPSPTDPQSPPQSPQGPPGSPQQTGQRVPHTTTSTSSSTAASTSSTTPGTSTTTSAASPGTESGAEAFSRQQFLHSGQVPGAGGLQQLLLLPHGPARPPPPPPARPRPGRMLGGRGLLACGRGLRACGRGPPSRLSSREWAWTSVSGRGLISRRPRPHPGRSGGRLPFHPLPFR